MKNQEIDTSFWPLHKIITLEQAAQITAQLRDEGKKIVTINGSFDILHGGHLNFLGEAKNQGDILFVGINSDRSISTKKGPDRPYISEQERAGLLAALLYTDYVIIIDAPYDDLPRELIGAVKPHVHVNGSEYGDPASWVEWPAIQAVGATGHVVARRPSLSTSDIIKKIQASAALE